MSLEIQQKFHVNDQCFDTMEEAELYLLNHADQVRVDAYVEYLRKNGAQRISRTITETVMDFIKFEKGEPSSEEETSQTPSEEPEAETEQVQEDSNVSEEATDVDDAPFDADPVEEVVQDESPKKTASSIFDDPNYAKQEEAQEEVPSEAGVFAQSEQTAERTKLFG